MQPSPATAAARETLTSRAESIQNMIGSANAKLTVMRERLGLAVPEPAREISSNPQKITLMSVLCDAHEEVRRLHRIIDQIDEGL